MMFIIYFYFWNWFLCLLNKSDILSLISVPLVLIMSFLQVNWRNLGVSLPKVLRESGFLISCFFIISFFHNLDFKSASLVSALQVLQTFGFTLEILLQFCCPKFFWSSCFILSLVFSLKIFLDNIGQFYWNWVTKSIVYFNESAMQSKKRESSFCLKT